MMKIGFKTRHMKCTIFPSLYGKWNASVFACDKYTLDDGFLNSNIIVINKRGLDPMEHNILEMASKCFNQQSTCTILLYFCNNDNELNGLNYMSL